MTRARAIVSLLLVLVHSSNQQRDENGAEHDAWHPRQRFSKTPSPISTLHTAAVNSAARLLALGKGDEALHICRNVLRSDAQHAPCLTMLARVYAARGDAAAARRSPKKHAHRRIHLFGTHVSLMCLCAFVVLFVGARITPSVLR